VKKQEGKEPSQSFQAMRSRHVLQTYVDTTFAQLTKVRAPCRHGRRKDFFPRGPVGDFPKFFSREGQKWWNLVFTPRNWKKYFFANGFKIRGAQGPPLPPPSDDHASTILKNEQINYKNSPQQIHLYIYSSQQVRNSLNQ